MTPSPEAIAKAEQLRAIMGLLRKEHDRVIDEHRAIPPTFFGNARKEHHELMGQSRMLKKLHTDFLKIHSELLGFKT